MPPGFSASAGASAAAAARSTFRAGLVAVGGAYVLWGVFPLYFLLMRPAGGVEVVAWRVLFSLAFCAALLVATRGWRRVAEIARRPSLLLFMGLAGALVFVNWLVYVWATLDGQVVEGSLGYFINPVVTVLLGVLVLRERLRPLQWVAVGVSAVAILVLSFAHGSVPRIALVLAFSFGLYGLVKKHVGPRVDAVSGLTLETAWLAPLAAVIVVVLASTGSLTFAADGVGHALLLVSTGVATAVPLLLFAAGTRRLPLVYVGFAQFIAPLLMFVIGVAVLHEDMPPERWAGFAIVWVALVLLVVDMVRAARAAQVTGR
ncbi:EamA family transporter RarD [Herbiconiux moechotypicola]|uniref:EamA family transporter RarD n=1 Tax=Herbiconiux moechotypicola TaxID=637393 RepID=A0ABN3DTC5_9MICO|nr:EamA family transporter RarD [Herbiconiux moechotypicola]MCS5730581.1 EamA family transporter RarD [Herbiconiux moechotypicola]